MAQTGYTPIQLYYSSTTTNVPLAANLAYGELAINITDGKLFYKDNANAIQVIGWKVVPATAGGTGQTSYAVGDLLYADTTTSLAKLPDVATGNALISGGVSTAPSWGKIGLTTHVSGTLPVTNGGTGTATAFTAGSAIFAGASGVYSQNNANYFWDNSNNRLGLGTASPTKMLNVVIGAVASRQNLDSVDRTSQNLLTVTNPQYSTDASMGIMFRSFPQSDSRQGAGIFASGGGSNNITDLNLFVSGLGGADTAYSAVYIEGSAGDVTVRKGNIIQGTAAKGVNFIANTAASGMTSQLLNWYEEGTWTPSPTNLTVVGTPTYTGKYTRIGRQVTCIACIDSTVTTAATAGSTSFGGLPFTASAIAGLNGGNGVTVDTNTVTRVGSGYIYTGNNKFYVSGWTATANIVMSFTYFV
jgi:hypothetical protein